MLKARFSNLGAYGGQANGDLIVDVSAADPNYTLRTDLAGVQALPLLRSTADFDKLDGKLQAKLALRSTGLSQRAIMSNLSGTVFAVFQDGAIKGLNVAQMIRSLTASTLSGWQEGKEQATDLTQLSASFRVERGQATTTDLNLVGPLVRVTGAGTIDLGQQALAFRVEPKLVMTTEGQGRTSDPVGLGIPVMIDGPWAQPRIYPDMDGILENPDAAYAKLKEMGQGLFGANGAGLGGLGGLINGGANTRAERRRQFVQSARRPARPDARQSPAAGARAGTWPEPQHSRPARPGAGHPGYPGIAPAERCDPAGLAGEPADERRVEAVVQSLGQKARRSPDGAVAKSGDEYRPRTSPGFRFAPSGLHGLLTPGPARLHSRGFPPPRPPPQAGEGAIESG